jgi:myo-inositol-1(or 4)-monophosphatase
MIDRDRLLQIVREAGRIAHSRWPGAGHALRSWDKTPNNMVSEADLEVDRFLKRELLRLLPSAAWLSEETADDKTRTDSGLIWLVDPIDGTRDFVGGRNGWAVSVALVSAERPLIGMLAAPARDEEWVAVAGQGATLNDVPLRASTRTQFAGARVPTVSLPKEDADLVAVDQPNSIALRIAMVADDRADLVATLR